MLRTDPGPSPFALSLSNGLTSAAAHPGKHQISPYPSHKLVEGPFFFLQQTWKKKEQPFDKLRANGMYVLCM